MGNVVAVDLGIVVIRIAVFDEKNDIFPYKLLKEKQRLDPNAKTYFSW